jgi:hypothetical protein
MGVDQTGKYIPTFPLDDLKPGRCGKRCAHLGDFAVSDEDIAAFQDALVRHGIDCGPPDEDVLGAG